MDKNNEKYRELKEKIFNTYGTEADTNRKMNVIAETLHAGITNYFWVGFYFTGEREMRLGPSAGPPACDPIGYEGVCGQSALKRETLIVPDVHKFPGHITCDPKSKSEIVVPVFNSEGELFAVLDVDSDDLDAFSETDKEFLEDILKISFS